MAKTPRRKARRTAKRRGVSLSAKKLFDKRSRAAKKGWKTRHRKEREASRPIIVQGERPYTLYKDFTSFRDLRSLMREADRQWPSAIHWSFSAKLVFYDADGEAFEQWVSISYKDTRKQALQEAGEYFREVTRRNRYNFIVKITVLGIHVRVG